MKYGDRKSVPAVTSNYSDDLILGTCDLVQPIHAPIDNIFKSATYSDKISESKRLTRAMTAHLLVLGSGNILQDLVSIAQSLVPKPDEDFKTMYSYMLSDKST